MVFKKLFFPFGNVIPKYLLLSFFLLGGLLPAKAQVSIQVISTDSLTYQLYLQQNWKQLVVEGKKAIDEGLDYYYMQMRVGIAYYELGNYRKSIRYFEAAHDYNPVNQLTIEYLYYAYLFSGRASDAAVMVHKFSAENKKRLKIAKVPIVEELYFEGGPGFSSNKKVMGDNIRRSQEDTIYNSSYYYDDLKYLFGGIKLRVHPNISIYQGYNFVDVAMTEKKDYLSSPLPDFYEVAHQSEYYGNMEIALNRGLKITPAWHLIWQDFDLQNAGYSDSLGRLLVDTMLVTNQDCIFSLSVLKDFSLFAVEVNGVYADFERRESKQIGVFFYSYPFGDLAFYTQTGVIGIWNKNDEEVIFHQMLGARILPYLWLEAEGSYGNLRDYVEKSAFVVYNTPEDINFKVEASVVLNINKHLDFSLRYRLTQRVNSYLTYSDFENFEVIKTNYNFNTIIGGLKWRF